MKTSLLPILSAIALFATASLAAAVPSPVEKLLRQAQEKIETGGYAGELKTIGEAHLALDKVLLIEPKHALAWYYKGYAAYTESNLQGGKGDAAARATALEAADQALEKSIQFGRMGEALALHATVLSVLVGVRGPESAASLSTRAAQEMAEARRLAPDSPRVAIQAGIAAFYTPPEWGGDVKKALALFEQATGAFATAGDLTAQPSWGRAEAHAWAGQAYEKTGDIVRARAEYEKALAVAPNYAWVRHALLPNLAKSSQ